MAANGVVRIRRILLAVLVAILLYGGVVAFSGYQAISTSLASFRWATLLGAVGLASCNYVLRFFKWQFYLRTLNVTGVSVTDSALIFLSGFVLTVTPGKVGEVFKSAVLAKTHGVPLETTAPVVIAERLTDVIAIVLLVSLGCVGFTQGIYWALAGGLAVSLLLFLIVSPAPTRWLFQKMAKSARGETWLPKLRAAHSSLLKLTSGASLGWPVVLSTVGWGLEGLALHWLLLGFSVSPALPTSLFFYATSTLAGALIPVPGGLGVTESILLEQLVNVAQVPLAIATSSMILIRFATLWWAVIVGFFSLALLRIRYPRALGGEDPSAPSTTSA